MDKLIKFLKSFGLTDQEIQKVFKDLPVNPEGFAGTNVAKGIFEKGGKKSSAQNPLIAETMISPFKLDKYNLFSPNCFANSAPYHFLIWSSGYVP